MLSPLEDMLIVETAIEMQFEAETLEMDYLDLILGLL